eukprot:Hpha_TRINITY_DN35032_c0_g1::TRINITY_DN35032_c0_g1_i1::g.82792::m.82792
MEETSLVSSSAQLQRTELALLLCQYRAQRLRLAVRTGRSQPRETRADFIAEHRARERQRRFDEQDRRKEAERARTVELTRLARVDREQRAAGRRRKAEKDEAIIAELGQKLRGCLTRIEAGVSQAALRQDEQQAANAAHERRIEKAARSGRRAELREFNRAYVAERREADPSGAYTDSLPSSSPTESPTESPRASPPSVLIPSDHPTGGEKEESDGDDSETALNERLEEVFRKVSRVRAVNEVFASGLRDRQENWNQLLKLPQEEQQSRDVIIGSESGDWDWLRSQFRKKPGLLYCEDDDLPPEVLEMELERMMMEREERLNEIVSSVKYEIALRPIQYPC